MPTDRAVVQCVNTSLACDHVTTSDRCEGALAVHAHNTRRVGLAYGDLAYGDLAYGDLAYGQVKRGAGLRPAQRVCWFAFA